MSLRIEGPARVVLEEGIDKVTSLDWHLASLDILAPFSEVLFDKGHRLLDCRHVRTKDALVAGHIGRVRRRFWHRVGEVEAGAQLFGLSDHFPHRQYHAHYPFQRIIICIAKLTTHLSHHTNPPTYLTPTSPNY